MENITNVVDQITAKANSILQDAMHAATKAEETLKHGDMDEMVKEKVRHAINEVSSIVKAIQAMRGVVQQEHQPLLDALTQALEQADEFKVQVEMLSARIHNREEEMRRLEQQFKEVTFPLLGKFTVPDPEVLPRIAALKMEIAGLYTAMGVSRTALATAEQGICAVREKLLSAPPESDSRITGLQLSLDAARSALLNLLEKHNDTFRQEIANLFSDENKRQLLELMQQHIPVPLPTAISEAIFMDAIQKIERLLVEVLPAELVAMMKDKNAGVNGKLDSLLNRLVEKLNKEIDLPLLDEEQEAWLFKVVIGAVTKSLKKGHLLDTVIENLQPIANVLQTKIKSIKSQLTTIKTKLIMAITNINAGNIAVIKVNDAANGQVHVSFNTTGIQGTILYTLGEETGRNAPKPIALKLDVGMHKINLNGKTLTVFNNTNYKVQLLHQDNL